MPRSWKGYLPWATGSNRFTPNSAISCPGVNPPTLLLVPLRGDFLPDRLASLDLDSLTSLQGIPFKSKFKPEHLQLWN